MSRPHAIVIRLDSLTGLQSSRILAKHGIPVIGIADNPKNYCSRTNSCKEVITSDTSNEELISKLIVLGKKLGNKSVIFPCSDDSVLAVSLHRDELKDWFEFVIPSHHTLDMLMDKVKLYNYLEQKGFPVPPTIYANGKSDIRDIADKVKYPCAVKPPRPSLSWFKHFSEKALKIHNPAELHEVYDRCLRAVDTFIIQEWVHGGDSNIYQYYYYFDKSCKPVLNYTSRKLRQWHIETGEACLVEQCHDDPVPRDLIDIYTEINFQGITSLEIKIDEITGEHFIIEPDVGRPNTSIGLVEASGTPILYAMYCDALDLPVPDNTNPKPGRMKWISLRRDIESSLKYHSMGQLSFKDWLKSLKGVNTFAVFSLRDTLPSLLDGWELMRNILNSSLHKFSGSLRALFKPRRTKLPE